MRRSAILLFWFFTLLTYSLFCVEAGAQATPLYKVGITYRTFVPSGPYEWRGAKTHGVISAIWYPAASDSVEEPQWIGPPDKPLLDAGKAARDAALASRPARFPMVLLSHGTGGSALNMGWLGTVLAAHGYIAVSVNHPGNNSYDGYTPAGFSLWWERARDLSTAIGKMLSDPTFGARIDPRRIGAAGYSLGGYTMIEIAGGITDLARWQTFCKSTQADNSCLSPREFPDLIEQTGKLSSSDPDYRQALRHAGDAYRDSRVRAVLALAPALGPAFTSTSLQAISIPVKIITGATDTIVPVDSSAKYFAAHIRGAELTIFPGIVDHYVFLPTCTDQGHNVLRALCTDAPGVDRQAIHAETINIALKFFAANLN